MEVGALRLTLVDDGGFRLDGGAMFGVVPKVLWQRSKPADERNRIAMRTNCLLVERGDDLLLLETGIGDKNDARFRDMFGMEEGATRLPERIAEAGYDVGDVSHVLLTHLHFDHCGWNTRDNGAGKLVPTFPRARYWLQRGEVAHARAPNARDAASYDPRNWEPLFDAGVVELFDDGAEPIPGVRAWRAPGHNADMCVVTFAGTFAGEGEGGKAGGDEHNGDFEGVEAIWLADLVPTVAHVAYPWIMSFDLFPLDTLASKETWLPRAAARRWTCFFGHEAEMPIARLVEERPGRLRASDEETPWPTTTT